MCAVTCVQFCVCCGVRAVVCTCAEVAELSLKLRQMQTEKEAELERLAAAHEAQLREKEAAHAAQLRVKEEAAVRRLEQERENAEAQFAVRPPAPATAVGPNGSGTDRDL